MSELFTNGDRPSLEKVLRGRELRWNLQEKLLLRFPEESLLSFKLNIPGPVKRNPVILRIFQIGMEDIESLLDQKNLSPLFEKRVDADTGPEWFLVVSQDARALKRAMVDLEESMPLGRLYDIDVLHREMNQIRSIERTEVGYPPRTCLVCGNEAKICAGARTHSLKELHEQIRECMKMERRMIEFG